MTLQECTAVLAPFVLELRGDFDDPTFRAYHRRLQDVPPRLLEAAVATLGATGLRFVPTAPELLAACEAARRAYVAANPYVGCPDCQESQGWRLGADGRARRCPCVAAYQDRLARAGMDRPLSAVPVLRDDEPLQLPAPTLDGLPTDVRPAVQALARTKGMR